MSDDSALIGDMVQRLLADKVDDKLHRAARAGAWSAELWAALEQMGVPYALLSEDQGGFGLERQDALGLLRLFGRHAVPLPVAETMLANALAAAAGLAPVAGPLAVVEAAHDLALSREGDGWRLSGNASRLPFAARLSGLLVEASADGVHYAIMLSPSEWTISAQGTNLAHEPRDEIAVDAVIGNDRVQPWQGLSARVALSVGVCLKIAGAMQRVLEMTVDHANERVQFGKPLSKFQAIQHELAKLASETAACGAAADMAAELFDDTGENPQAVIAAARLRCGEAAGIATSIAHQTHGAIGFTAEHRLHFFTNALWGWRDEYGSAPYWSRTLGGAALAAGPDNYWRFVTAA